MLEKLTIVAVDDFILRSTAPDADPATMLVLATASQDWLNANRDKVDQFYLDLACYGQAQMEFK